MHPYISELEEQYLQGRVSRREFMRMSVLLGLSLSNLTAFLTSCAPKEAAPTEAPTAMPSATPVPPVPTATSGPKRGGIITAVNTCRRLDDPATVESTQPHILRNVVEYLTVTNQDNITVPWLLEQWEPSDDLKTWTLYLRKGIKFNHGPELTADDVVFNFGRWLDPDFGSSAFGLMSGYLSSNNVEKVDDYTVRLHLDSPQIAIPEHLYHQTTAILPKDFEGNWMDNPVGTGPYTLNEYYPGERVMLSRREGYWRMGVDGEPLPYMDGIRFIALEDQAAIVAALTTGEIDLTEITRQALDALEPVSDVVIASQVSAYTEVVRMRADLPPFDDVRVRNAIKACQNRAQILEAAYGGYGALGEDHHVAPIHPEYCPMDVPERDLEKAKALLAEAGYENGLEVDLAVINIEPCKTIAQLLKSQCEPAGITINLNVMPSSLYWDQWMDVAFGITAWGHRALATVVLDLAYKTGAAWNETHWSNEQFDNLLAEAESTYDIEKRRKIMCDIQTIMKEEGPVAISCWFASLYAHRRRVKGYRVAPSLNILNEVWLDDAA